MAPESEEIEHIRRFDVLLLCEAFCSSAPSPFRYWRAHLRKQNPKLSAGSRHGKKLAKFRVSISPKPSLHACSIIRQGFKRRKFWSSRKVHSQPSHSRKAGKCRPEHGCASRRIAGY